MKFVKVLPYALISAIILSLLCAVGSSAAGFKAGDHWTFEYKSKTTARIPDEPESTTSYSGSIPIEIESVNTKVKYSTIRAGIYGYGWGAVKIKSTKSVVPENRYLSISCSSSDTDDNGYAESFYASMVPSEAFFVDPTWEDHETGWDSSIDDAENQPCVTVKEERAEDGEFYAKLEADYESDYDNDGNNEKGTYTVELKANYDSDGVALSYSQTSRIEYDDGGVVEMSTEMSRKGIEFFLWIVIAAVIVAVIVAIIVLRRRRRARRRALTMPRRPP